MVVVATMVVVESPQQVEERGGEEKEEKKMAREKRRRTGENGHCHYLTSREPAIRARVLVVTKSVDPDTLYRPRLSRSLACRRLYLPTRLHLPIHQLADSWGGCCAPLSRGRARARARSTDACRRGLPILRAGGARPRASPTWIEGSVDPEVVNRANQLDRCQPWRADRAGGCQSECNLFLHPVAVLAAGPIVAGAPRSIQGRSPNPKGSPGHRWKTGRRRARRLHHSTGFDHVAAGVDRECQAWVADVPGDLQVIWRGTSRKIWSGSSKHRFVRRRRCIVARSEKNRRCRDAIEAEATAARQCQSRYACVSRSRVYEEASYFLVPSVAFVEITTDNGRDRFCRRRRAAHFRG